MKCQHPCPAFEFRGPCPLLTTITITPRAENGIVEPSSNSIGGCVQVSKILSRKIFIEFFPQQYGKTFDSQSVMVGDKVSWKQWKRNKHFTIPPKNKPINVHLIFSNSSNERIFALYSILNKTRLTNLFLCNYYDHLNSNQGELSFNDWGWLLQSRFAQVINSYITVLTTALILFYA